MPKENPFESLYTHDTIYLPPSEEKSAALEVCLGCSWGKCRFCDFAKDEFSVNGTERIEGDLEVLSQLQAGNPRMFFLGENAFCLPTESLVGLMHAARHHMPHLREFAMYARIDDIAAKSDDDLALLAAEGLDALHVGIESGCDDILADMHKGFTADEAVRQLHRLDATGIGYHLTIIGGLGGRAHSHFHALGTARLLDQVNPRSVWHLKLHVFEGTALHRQLKLHQFDQMTPVEVLQEEYFMLQNLHKVRTWYMDTTVLDKCTLQGNIPEDMEELLLGCSMLIRNANFL